jgi:hypothetical protein
MALSLKRMGVLFVVVAGIILTIVGAVEETHE